MHIIVAPNAFKNGLSAQAAAEAICEGLNRSLLQCTSECFPIGDGGDGTAELIVKKYKGKYIETEVQDPFGKYIRASFGLINNNRTAVIEMANASGLKLIERAQRDPLKATSYGTGELIKKALDYNVEEIIIAAGGSATVDGGVGALKALGIKFLNSKGLEVGNTAVSLNDLAATDLQGLDQRILGCKITVLCDVRNTLLGKDGSAAMFGPQKGATKDQVVKLEMALTAFRNIVQKEMNRDLATIIHGGAAGGFAAGLQVFLNAELTDGALHFLDLMDFKKSLKRCNLLVTAEGSIDEQTLMGKGPFCVAMQAKEKNIPVIALAGQVPLQCSADLKKYFDVLMSIGNEPTDLATAIGSTSHNLTRIAREIGDLLAISPG